MKVLNRQVSVPRLTADNSDSLLGGLIAVASISVSILDLLGLLGGALTERLPALTLLLVALVSLYLIFERHANFEDARQSISQIDQHVREQFERVLAEYADLASRLRHVDSFFGAAAAGDRFSQLRMIYATRELSKLSGDHTISLGREYIFPAWLDCVNSAHSFDAFNYVTPREVWRSGWFEDVSHAAQVGRLLQGATIRRLFVVDGEEEISLLAPLMDRQVNAGIEVRWALLKDVQEIPMVKDNLIRLGTNDLMAFDDQLVFRVFLDDSRSMTSCSISTDRHMVDLVRQVVASGVRVSQLWVPSEASE